MLTLLTSCITESTIKTIQVDPEFQTYLSEFETKNKIRVDDLVIKFSNLDTEAEEAAICSFKKNVKKTGTFTREIIQTPEIRISPTAWNDPLTDKTKLIETQLEICLGRQSSHR